MVLSDRIKYIMKINQLSATAFADEIGVQRSSISHVLSGRNKPSLEFIQKILNTYPKISADWLISGKTVTKENNTRENTETSNNTPPTPIVVAKEIKKVVVFYTDNTFEELNKSI